MNTRGDARDTPSDGNQRNKIWALLDDAYSEPEHDKFEAAEKKFHDYRRNGRTSISIYLTTRKRYKKEYLKEDPRTNMGAANAR